MTAGVTYGSSEITDTGLAIPRGINMNGLGPHLIGGHTMVEVPPPAGNKPRTIQDDADAVVKIGTVITSFRRLGLAIRDRRCQRQHLLVLYALMEKLHRRTGTAFPARRAIAEQEGLKYETVENALYDLRRWGHIDWEMRAAPDLHDGRLLHYTLPVTRFTEEDITKAIVALRTRLGDGKPGPQEVKSNAAQKSSTRRDRADDAEGRKGQKPPTWAPTSDEIDAGFNEWWEAYPRKEDQGDARRAYAKCLMHKDQKERATIAQLLAAVKACTFPAERRYIKLPATWLNKGSWQNVSTQAATPAGRPPGLDERTDRLHAALEDVLGMKIYGDWFKTLRIEDLEGERLTVSVTSKFLKTWVEQHYSDQLAGVARAALGGVQRVDVVVRDSTP
jgi:hypothetical protein